MTPDQIVLELERNREVFNKLLAGVPGDQQRWRPVPDKWSLHEVVCHLYDEERDDFRRRVRSTLEDPERPWPGIDPQGWVTERGYAEKDYDRMLQAFLEERDASIEWLRSLEAPKWDNTHHHPQIGPMTAKLMLVNWLAHDLFHVRQIVRLKYGHLGEASGESLRYAGRW